METAAGPRDAGRHVLSRQARASRIREFKLWIAGAAVLGTLVFTDLAVRSTQLRPAFDPASVARAQQSGPHGGPGNTSPGPQDPNVQGGPYSQNGQQDGGGFFGGSVPPPGSSQSPGQTYSGGS